MDDLRILYVTTEDRDEARSIGDHLVTQKLCACVNIIGQMESIYEWKDEIQHDTECVMLVKTTRELSEKATDAILNHHSYEVPCVISLPLSADEGNPEYLNWIKQCVTQ